MQGPWGAAEGPWSSALGTAALSCSCLSEPSSHTPGPSGDSCVPSGPPELSILQSLSMAPPLFSQDGCVCFVSSRAVFPLTSLVRIHHRAPSGSSFLGDGVAGRRIVRGPTHPVLPAPDPPRPRVAPHIHPGSTSPGGVEQPWGREASGRCMTLTFRTGVLFRDTLTSGTSDSGFQCLYPFCKLLRKRWTDPQIRLRYTAWWLGSHTL